MDKLERVARAICTAKGIDPDRDSGQGEWMTITEGNEYASRSSRQRRPAASWQAYASEAKVFIAAHEALISDPDQSEFARMQGELGGVHDATKHLK